MNKISIQNYKSEFGELIIGVFEGKLCLCDWRFRKMRSQIDQRIRKGLSAEFLEQDDDIIEETKSQLQEYFSGKRIVFDLPTALIGSNFQINVWKELETIPYGKTESYTQLSRKLNNEGAIRAVASANGANALSIIVPCHRIIGSHGELTGYAGGLKVKKKLLELENPDIFGNQLELFP